MIADHGSPSWKLKCIVAEVGWSGSNGGLSKAFVQPLYQKGLNTNGSRGVPDLAANGDPYSGFKICYANKCSQTAGKNFLKKNLRIS